jgi:hypothetical protein
MPRKGGALQQKFMPCKGGALQQKFMPWWMHLQNPAKFILTAGQTNYITQATKLTENISNTEVLADKGLQQQ